MKKTIFFVLLICPVFLFTQELPSADALVSPKIAKGEITVGGENALITGFNSQSIQFAIDALEETGGTIKYQPGGCWKRNHSKKDGGGPNQIYC